MEETEKDMAKVFLTAEKDKKSNYTIEDYALSFVSGMSNTQRKRFKQMLEQGIKCGECIALNYGVNYDDLMNEVKRVLKVEVKND